MTPIEQIRHDCALAEEAGLYGFMVQTAGLRALLDQRDEVFRQLISDRSQAIAVKPVKAAAPKIAKPNKRRGKPSIAFASVRLPIYQRQACGHYFNSSGCAVCVQCDRRPARWVAEGPSFSTALDTRERAAAL